MRISDWSSDVCSSDLCQRQYGDWQHTLADAPEPERALRQWKTSQLTQMLGQKFQHALKHDHVSGTQDSIAQPFDQPLPRTGDRQKIKAITLMYQNGRASCRERVCQYVYISVVAGYLKKKY